MQCANQEDVPPVIATPHHYLINIFRNNLYFVAVLTNEGKVFLLAFDHILVEKIE